MVTSPHWNFPYVRGKVVEQDTPEHIVACQARIASCPLGFRDERPEFGWTFPIYRPTNLNLDELEDALRRFEPRGSNISVTALADLATIAAAVTTQVSTTP
jgi:phage baseplate assembly protein W